MDFTYNDEQQMLQDSVRKFVQNRYDFETRGKILAEPAGYSEENWQLFAELGWLTVPFREEDGGFGGAATDLMVMMEAFGRGLVVEPFLATAVIGGGLVGELGNTEQKQSLIGAVMEGKLQLACAYAEKDGRHNLASVATRASRDGAHYVIDGEKIVVLNGPAADRILVVARTGGTRYDEEGISLFLVDGDSAGLHRNGYTTVDGHRAAELRIEGVKVPASALLGAEGQALPALQRVIDRAALAVCAEGVGAMDCLLQRTIDYARTRKQFGTVIGSFQALQHRMAEMFIECELARSIVMRAAMMLDGDGSALEKRKAVSAAKSRAGRAMRSVGQEAIQIHGGIGMSDELDVGHYFKRLTAIGKLFGSTDVHTMRYAAL